MKLTTVALALALFVPAISGAQESDTPAQDKTTDKSAGKNKQAKKLNEEEIKILSHVQHVNKTEIDLGKHAQRVATAPVKKYAEMVVADHQQSNKQLMKLAKDNGVAKIPMMKPQTDADKQMAKDMKDEITAMKKLKGADFDRAYLQMMVKNHEAELAKTEPMIEASSNSDIDMFLQNRKATLQRHVDAAKELQKQENISRK